MCFVSNSRLYYCTCTVLTITRPISCWIGHEGSIFVCGVWHGAIPTCGRGTYEYCTGWQLLSRWSAESRTSHKVLNPNRRTVVLVYSIIRSNEFVASRIYRRHFPGTDRQSQLANKLCALFPLYPLSSNMRHSTWPAGLFESKFAKINNRETRGYSHQHN